MGWELYLDKAVTNDRKGPGGELAQRKSSAALFTSPPPATHLCLTSPGISPQSPGEKNENVMAVLTFVPLEHIRAPRSSSLTFTRPPLPGQKQLRPRCP